MARWTLTVELDDGTEIDLTVVNAQEREMIAELIVNGHESGDLP